jgi:hypothetical protein
MEFQFWTVATQKQTGHAITCMFWEGRNSELHLSVVGLHD